MGVWIMQALAEAVKTVAEDVSVRAGVIVGAGTFFMAGADIALTLGGMQANPESAKANIQAGNELMSAIESGSKPWVAAINGSAFGGGLELAMACASRISVPKAQFGLPEIKLGIFPGMGGTQRLPKLIGVEAATPLILSGQPINADFAVKLGLIDYIVNDPKNLLEEGKKLALAIADGKYGRRQTLSFLNKMRDPALTQIFLDNAAKEVKKRFGPLPHPQLAIQAIRAGVVHSGKKGVETECELFAKVIQLPTAKAGVHFFLSEKLCPKVPGVSGKQSNRKIQRLAILGAGTMGAGIATVCLQKGLFVILKEIKQEFLDAGIAKIKSNLERFAKKKKLSNDVVAKFLQKLQPQLGFEDFGTLDLVIEAAIENLKVKQDIFSQIESVCSPSCILATNTSTINIDLIGNKTQAAERIIGLHFFSPANVMPLLEIVRTKSTAPSVIADCILWGQAIGKTTAVVGNCVGFAANRAFFPYGQAGGFLLDHGVSPFRVDAALKKFGMPMGIFEVSDLSGLDIGEAVGKIYLEAYPDRVYVSPSFSELVKSGRLGQKNGKGFYKYEAGKKPVPDTSLLAFFNSQREKLGLKMIDKLKDEEIVEILLFPCVNEALRIVAEGVVVRASDLDIISITGYGFNMWKGGLVHWGETVGFKYIYDKLQKFSDLYSVDTPAAKGFFAPSAALKQKAGY